MLSTSVSSISCPAAACTRSRADVSPPRRWAARKLLCGGGGGGDGMGTRRRRWGGAPEMGFRAGPFVLCKDGCCHQRRRNTNFGPEKFFSRKKFPPHMCSQNDQRDVGIILSHVCWVWTPPPPARQVGQPQPKPPSRHGRPRRGRGGQMGFRAIPPPAKQFSSRLGKQMTAGMPPQGYGTPNQIVHRSDIQSINTAHLVTRKSPKAQ